MWVVVEAVLVERVDVCYPIERPLPLIQKGLLQVVVWVCSLTFLEDFS